MENFEKYVEYTKTRDWSAICKLNDVELDSFGTKKELKVLPEYLEPDEVVFALTSGIMSQTETSNSLDFGANTWLVALTNDRFLFLDAAMLTSSVDTQSIRHDRVQAVSASQGLIFGKIMASLANKWLKELGEKKDNLKNAVLAVSQTPLLDMFERLDKLASLGALTDREFNESKEKLLSSDKFKAEKGQFLSSFP